MAYLNPERGLQIESSVHDWFRGNDKAPAN